VSEEWKLTILTEKALISRRKRRGVIEGVNGRGKEVIGSEGSCTDALQARELLQVGLWLASQRAAVMPRFRNTAGFRRCSAEDGVPGVPSVHTSLKKSR
jgi:hypothetical protein